METSKHKPHVNIGVIKSIKSDTKILEKASHQIEKLEADKAELLEALENLIEDEQLSSEAMENEIESLIQKHKQ